MFSRFRSQQQHEEQAEHKRPVDEDSARAELAECEAVSDDVAADDSSPSEVDDANEPVTDVGNRQKSLPDHPDNDESLDSDYEHAAEDVAHFDSDADLDEALNEQPDDDSALVADGDEPVEMERSDPPSEQLGAPKNRPAVFPRLSARRPGQALAPAAVQKKTGTFTAEQRLLLLDTWQRSGLAAGDFADLVGVSKHTLYAWKKRFEKDGPAGLMDQPRGMRKGSRLPDITKRAILMLKQAHPDWGCQRISDMLLRGPALPASASAVARVLKEAGYEAVDRPSRSHPDKVRRFERAKPNQLWQTDLFTFMLKRQNRRLHLVAFMDDHSRFIVSFGLHASASTALVLEALEAGIASYGPPEEVLTDNGPQYVTWRGKSQFTKRLEKHGIRQIVARPRRPQTLGKIERFWGTLWREFLETSVFVDLGDARTRIGLFIDYFNFQRVHRGIDGLVPADRFFGASAEILQTLKERVSANALELARHGSPQKPFYVTGQVDGQSFSVHAEGQRLILRRAGGEREEVTLNGVGDKLEESATGALPQPVCPQGAPTVPEGEPACGPPPEPGQSVVDELVEDESSETEGGVS